MTATDWPPIVNVAVRAATDGVLPALIITALSPTPVVMLAVSQDGRPVRDHGASFSDASMVSTAVPPAAGRDTDAGATTKLGVPPP